jgi:glycosyltransferase involved in cell wall biosynthesis
VRHFAYLLQGAYLARRANADGVTHIHAHFASNAAAVAMLSRIMGGPEYSFTVHGPHDFFDAPLLSVGDKIGNARFVAAITNYCQSQLRLYAKAEDWPKIRIIPCGIFLDEFSKAPTVTSQDFVCVGRLCPEKGQRALPAVMAQVAKSHPDAKVLLVGDGPDRSAIESEIARLGVEKNIELLGWRTGAEVAALMKQTRALILPTYAEGLPIVIMEALARSRPVITTYIAGIPELVDEACGWIYPAGDEDALLSAINEALEADAQKLERLGGEGRRRVTERHDQHRNAALLLNTIKEAGNESREKVKTS